MINFLFGFIVGVLAIIITGFAFLLYDKDEYGKQ